MKINKQAGDKAILVELGERLAKVRLDRNRTQAGLASQAGVSKRTVERMEKGGSTQVSSLIRLCRALDLVERFDKVVPDLVPSPIAQLKLRGRRRQRASPAKTSGKTSIRQSNRPATKWTWGDHS